MMYSSGKKPRIHGDTSLTSLVQAAAVRKVLTTCDDLLIDSSKKSPALEEVVVEGEERCMNELEVQPRGSMHQLQDALLRLPTGTSRGES